MKENIYQLITNGSSRYKAEEFKKPKRVKDQDNFEVVFDGAC